MAPQHTGDFEQPLGHCPWWRLFHADCGRLTFIECELSMQSWVCAGDITRRLVCLCGVQLLLWCPVRAPRSCGIDTVCVCVAQQLMLSQ